MITLVGKLTQEDLNRMRIAGARKRAVESNPHAFSAGETERAYLDEARLIGELCATYGVDGTRDYSISLYTGDIWYDD